MVELEEIQKSWDAFIKDATKLINENNKSAGRRARIASIDLREQLKNWRKISLIK